MKKYLLLALIIPAAIPIIFSVNNTNKWQRPDSPLIENPSDWMAYQRAYPYWSVNMEAYKVEMKKAAAMQSQSINKSNWTFAGPTNIGGRITDIEIVPGTTPVIYVGAATGGILKSTDNGNTWQNIFQNMPFISIGDLAIDPANPNIIYAGTGEANASANTFLGGGIYKSMDAGATWTFSGLPNSAYIGRVLVDPENSNRIFVAACGNLFTPNPERGIYRSLDAGATWDRVLYLTDSTSAIDIAQDPSRPDTLYAAMWERIRGLNYRRSYGPSSGIFRSVDGGTTWTELTNGLPVVDMGRIGIAVAPSNPDFVYAFIDSNYGIGICRSEDAGNSWSYCTNTGLQDMCSTYGWYFGQIRVNPLNEYQIYVMGLKMVGSNDGGQTWQLLAGDACTPYIHVDHHAMAFDQQNGRILEGNDGGLCQSFDNGVTWSKINNLPITQFYEVEIDYNNPTRIYGGTQDNFSIGTQTGNTDDWIAFLGGDGFYCIVDYTDPNTFYMESQYGMLHKTTYGGASMTGICYYWSGDRTNWSSPYVMHPTDPHTLYFGTYRVWKTTDGGNSWINVSPDLTKGDDGSSWHTLSTMSISPVNGDIIVTGSDDGKVYLSANAGGTWTDISTGLPDRCITRVACDPNNQNRIYVTVSGFRWDEPYPHVLRSDNLGSTWTDISGNLPNIPVDDFAVDPLSGYLFVGTDAGVFASSNNGGTWNAISGNIGNVPVTTLKIHNPSRTLVAGTYGLSVWKLDLTTFVSSPLVDNEKESGVFNVFPVPYKPGNSQCTFSLAGGQFRDWSVTIYDQTGKLCTKLESSFDSETINWNGMTYNGSELPAGVYYCHAMAGDKKFVKKMVIQ